MENRVYGMFFALLAVLLLAGFASAAATPAANDTEDAIVSVTISSVTWVNIDPDTLSWTGVSPGTQAGAETNGYFAIEIENIGSNNITKVWANTTYETLRPWGTGAVGRYDAGNFVLLTNRTYGGSPYYFVNRVEYNESDVLVYLKDPASAMPPSGYSYGRIRNASNEYFWMILNSGGDCAGASPPTLRIGTVPHTKTQSGTTDFSGVADTEIAMTQYNGGGGNMWAYAAINAGAFNGYCVAVAQNCGVLWLYKWNMDAPAASLCSNAGYLLSSTGGVGALAPGAYFASNISIRVPYGVAVGTTTGVLTILASDQ